MSGQELQKKELSYEERVKVLDKSGLVKMLSQLGDIGSHSGEVKGLTTKYSNFPVIVTDATLVVDGIGKDGWGRVYITAKTDGSIDFQGESTITLSKNDLQREDSKEKVEEALGKAYKNPQPPPKYDPSRETNTSSSGPEDRSSLFFTSDSCLSGGSLISAENGSVPVKNLRAGDLVWTVDESGQKIQAIIVKTNRRLVSKDHKMAHIVLEDGRKLVVSPGHPTIDNKELGSLKKGQILDKSKIASIKIMPYKEKYTYDILSSGETGGYWANGILIGSTLSSKFRKIQREKYFGACYFV